MCQDGTGRFSDAITALEQEIEQLRAALSVLRRKAAEGGDDAQPPSLAGAGQNGQGAVAGVQSDSFFGMTAVDASVKFLQMTKRPQSTKAIEIALRDGGITTTARNFYSNLYTALTRDDRFVKPSKGKWGLKDWYPGRVFKKDGGKKGRAETEDQEEDS